MDRRDFFKTGAAASVLTGVSGCRIEKIHSTQKETFTTKSETIAGLTLTDLREKYRSDLFDDFLPFIDKFVVDHEIGGFMCTVDRDGKQVSSDKTAWYEGRGIWVYSYLYNKIDKNPKYLEIAKKSIDFIMKLKPKDGKFWNGSFTREGKPISGPGDIYGNLFIANGLQEYSKSEGNEKYWDIAKDMVLNCMKIYDQPLYKYNVSYGPENAVQLKGPRVIGHWMVFINTVTEMLDNHPDPELEKIAERSVDAIINSHYNPDYGLINEVLNHDLSRPKEEWAQFSYTGHAIETLWMVLYESARKKDRALFDKAAEYLRRHIEVAWDDVYGGAFRALDNVDKNIWKVDKACWLQEEILIGTMFIMEHTGAEWAKDWFGRTYDYVQKKFTLKQYGFPLWISYADRKVTFEPHAARAEHFHHPRHLMLNLLALDRMIKRNGMTSDLFK